MKTAISIPDPIFDEAEKVAKRLKLSRSELYARAVAAFVEQQRASNITEKLDQIYGKVESGIDPELVRAQIRSLDEENW
jgi:metal-responsive CopG/Arc/MetJ family transcriptional regulator